MMFLFLLHQQAYLIMPANQRFCVELDEGNGHIKLQLKTLPPLQTGKKPEKKITKKKKIFYPRRRLEWNDTNDAVPLNAEHCLLKSEVNLFVEVSFDEKIGVVSNHGSDNGKPVIEKKR